MENLQELQRIRRVTDMMVTAHALLKERYIIFSLISDVLLFVCATILCIITFADKAKFAEYLGTRYALYVGILAFISFVYSFVANQLNWKVKAEKHKSAFDKYMELKFECISILKEIDKGEKVDITKFLGGYYTITPCIISIPENLFLRCKKNHVLKVFISKYIDEHPSTFIPFLRIKLWIRDNCKSSNKHR